MPDILFCITGSNNTLDGNSVEEVQETDFYFIASKQDEEDKLMSTSQVELSCCFFYQIALSPQVSPLKMH